MIPGRPGKLSERLLTCKNPMQQGPKSDLSPTTSSVGLGRACSGLVGIVGLVGHLATHLYVRLCFDECMAWHDAKIHSRTQFCHEYVQRETERWKSPREWLLLVKVKSGMVGQCRAWLGMVGNRLSSGLVGGLSGGGGGFKKELLLFFTLKAHYLPQQLSRSIRMYMKEKTSDEKTYALYHFIGNWKFFMLRKCL